MSKYLVVAGLLALAACGAKPAAAPAADSAAAMAPAPADSMKMAGDTSKAP